MKARDLRSTLMHAPDKYEDALREYISQYPLSQHPEPGYARLEREHNTHSYEACVVFVMEWLDGTCDPAGTLLEITELRLKMEVTT